MNVLYCLGYTADDVMMTAKNILSIVETSSFEN